MVISSIYSPSTKYNHEIMHLLVYNINFWEKLEGFGHEENEFLGTEECFPDLYIFLAPLNRCSRREQESWPYSLVSRADPWEKRQH